MIRVMVPVVDTSRMFAYWLLNRPLGKRLVFLFLQAGGVF